MDDVVLFTKIETFGETRYAVFDKYDNVRYLFEEDSFYDYYTDRNKTIDDILN